MIEDIFPNSAWMTVNSSKPYVAFIGTQASSGVTGEIRWNAMYNYMEVYTGSGWQRLSHTPTIDLNSRTQSILTWAETKMREEAKLEELYANQPQLKELKDLHDFWVTMSMK